jgi:hypothetical protein
MQLFVRHFVLQCHRVDLPFVLGINALDQAHVEATMAQYGGHSHVDPTVSLPHNSDSHTQYPEATRAKEDQHPQLICITGR